MIIIDYPRKKIFIYITKYALFNDGFTVSEYNFEEENANQEEP